jgi:uncharacterized protein YktB (UPF0637 family)
MIETKQADEGLLSLEQIERAAQFEGFEPADFEVFEAPDFSQRMPRLKARITPKLKLVAAALNERMTETLGEVVYPHVALHLRRSVNPPVETWAAFARNARAYKPYVHLRAAISADRVRVLVFVEDYADEKETFAINLARNASALAAIFAHNPTIHAYDMLDAEGKPRHGRTLDARTIRAFAERMKRVKGQHARFGIAFASTHPVVANGPELLDAVVEAARQLRPLYDCGKPGYKVRSTPDPIALP